MGQGELPDLEVVRGGEEPRTTGRYRRVCLSGRQTQKPGGGLATDTARRCTVFKMVTIISQGVMAADSSQRSLLRPKGAALLKGLSPPCQGKPIFHDWLIRDTKTRSPFLNSGKLWRAIPAPELPWRRLRPCCVRATRQLLPGPNPASLAGLRVLLPGALPRIPTHRLYFSGGRTCERGDDIQVFVFVFNYLFQAVLRFRCCAGSSLVAASRGYSLVAVPGLLIAVPSLVVEHRL